MNTTERLFNLLPSHFRRKDMENRHALRALMAVVEKHFNGLESDISGLYDNWFTETCDEWALPYLAELVGITDLKEAKNIVTSQRRRIANAIRYRRRKGTAAALENVIYDVSGWYAFVVELFNVTSITQSVRSIRTDMGRTADVKDMFALEQLYTPFDSTSHLADVRTIHSDNPGRKKGRYKSSNVGIFLWRLNSYPVVRGYARKTDVENSGYGTFTFNATGYDTQLFNASKKVDSSLFGISEMSDLPIALTGNILTKNLGRYYGPGKSFCVTVKGERIPSGKIAIADLSNWNEDSLQDGKVELAVDPKPGRMLFKDGSLNEGDVLVDYHYGFSGDIGGGSYDRLKDLTNISGDIELIRVAKGSSFANLDQAIKARKKSSTVIRIMDSAIYRDGFSLDLKPGEHLTIEAEDGCSPVVSAPGSELIIKGPENAADKEATLALNGLRMDKRLRLQGRVRLNILHSTVMVGKDNLAAAVDTKGSDADEILVSIFRSITGPLLLPSESVLSLGIKESIIHGGPDFFSIAADKSGGSGKFAPPVSVNGSTILGKVKVRELEASNVIFAESVEVQRRQLGYARFCYLPKNSKTPIRYRCQPDAGETKIIRPVFTSVQYGAPGYAQLRHDCPAEIGKGAEDGSEMGAFKMLRQPHREENIKKIMNDYVGADMDAGFFYADESGHLTPNTLI